LAKVATPIAPAKTGIVVRNPASERMLSEPVRSASMPAIRKSAPVERPCATI
jgi:hypothetical protein